MLISDVDTPALLIDLGRLRSNIDRMSHLARNADMKLRPHTKTHKCVEIAKMQLDAGASGIAVAKVGEAEVMADAGIDDILIAHEVVGAAKIERLIQLAKRAKVAVGVDSVEAAMPLSMMFAQHGMRLRVLIEVDTGLHRCGVQPEAVVEFARAVNSLPGLSLAGVFTYPGHVYAARNENEVEGVAAYECRVMGEVAQRVAPLATPGGWVSGGSTPTAPHYHSDCGLSEMRPGTYVFNDRTQLDRWAAKPADCAMTVLATVVSTPEPGRAVLDAGSKSLTSDLAPASPGHGMLKEDASAVIVRVNEEHGFVDLTKSQLKLRVGDKVEVIPNHCCTVTNLFDEMLIVNNREIVDTWQVAARGRLR
ncbi:MAG: D-TA family PLP-dependent enzyme [Armatimonadota bacterium]